MLSRPPDAATVKPIDDCQRILLRGDQISDIVVQYISEAAPSEPSAPPGSKPRLTGRLRSGAAKLLGLPPESAWRELLEAPSTLPAAAGRLLAGELIVLFVVAVISRFA